MTVSLQEGFSHRLLSTTSQPNSLSANHTKNTKPGSVHPSLKAANAGQLYMMVGWSLCQYVGTPAEAQQSPLNTLT